MAESGVKRNIPGRCGNALAVNGDPGWGDVGRHTPELGGEGAARGLAGGGTEPAGDRSREVWAGRPRRSAQASSGYHGAQA